MKVKSVVKILDYMADCPVCGDEYIGDISIGDSRFERNCKKCGWHISGKTLEDGTVAILEDNELELIEKRSH